jgi:hypothetical protein
MTETERQKLVSLADVLLSTLGDIPAEQADRIVKDAIDAIYNDLLGVPGTVQRTGTRICDVNGSGRFLKFGFIKTDP